MEKWTLPPKLHQYIYKKDIDKALGLLSKISAINEQGLLTKSDEEYLHYVGAFRVQLLMELGYYREALAWACLEVELYPENIRAFIFKESIKKKLYNLPSSQSNTTILNNKTNEWEGIAGMREVKAVIEQDLVIPLTNPSLYKKYKVGKPNGYLFYGPPGCGKTFFAHNLAKRLGYNFISTNPADLGSTYVHGTQIEIKRIFAEAEKKAPCLLFFDEFESIAPKRTSNDVSFHYKSEVNELLTQLNNISEKGILFIAATNFIKNIDSAILRPGRIDKSIFIGPPDYEARIESYRIQLKNRPVKKINLEYISEMSEYFTHADIEYICNEAAKQALSRKILINTDLLGSIVFQYKPSLNQDELSEYFK